MNTEKIKVSTIFLIAVLLTPIFVSANVVWPSLYILEGMMSWYVILIGFVIETAFVKYFLKDTYLKAVLIAFVMNLVSAVLGVLGIPISGLIVEILLIPFDTGTFHITHWLASYLFAILLNVAVEGLTVKIIFKHKFKKMFWWLFVANAISVFICILFHGTLMQNLYM